ncbi:hypothetical protein EDD11_007709, partial [Mortierella claussenii]
MDNCTDGSQEAKGPRAITPSISATNSSAWPSTPSAARLPNECLHMIVDYLSTDIRTLHSLLLVNRFFFHAALPHLMTVLSWQEGHHTRIFLDSAMSADIDGIAQINSTTTQDSRSSAEAEWTRRDQLLLVVLMSFLESRLLKRQQQREAKGGEQRGQGQVKDRKSNLHHFSVAQEVEAALEPFGLRLARETIHVHEGEGNRGRYIRGSLSARAAAMIRYLQGSTGTTGSEEMTSADQHIRRRLSLDYSKYFTDPWMIGGWWRSNLCQLIHLCRLPEELQGGDIDVDEDAAAVDWTTVAATAVATAEVGEHEVNGDGMEALEQIASVQVHAGANGSINSNSNSNSTNNYGNSTNVGHTTRGVGQGVDSHDIDASDDDGEVHTKDQQHDGYYAAALEKSFASMLCCYNLKHITTFIFNVAKPDTYLPLADRMKDLKIIVPQGSDADIPLLSKVSQFIHKNQSAFPRKGPLDLDSRYIRYRHHVANTDYNDPVILLRRDEIIEDVAEFQRLLRAFRAFKETQRLQTVKTMRPYLELYRDIGRPRRMNIRDIPMAYEHLLRGSGDLGGDRDEWPGQGRDEGGAIGLDWLVEFKDSSLDRLDYGEGPLMEQFFRRCHRLQKLNMAVRNPELFS